MPITYVSTRYMNNFNNFNFVIHSMFLQANAEEFDTHIILLDLQSPSNHALLVVNIIVRKEFIQDKRRTIVKNSEEEARFIKELTSRVRHIDMTNISDCKTLERTTQEFIAITEKLWIKYSKCVNITKYSKIW